MAEPVVTSGRGRVEAFSDGVIAILITIMVLELKIPDAFASGFDAGALQAFAPKLLAYAMSFLTLAIMWVNHHYLTSTLRRVEPGFLWINNLQLFLMSLIPLSTAFFGDHPGSAPAAALYSAVLAANGWTFLATRLYMAAQETEDADLRAVHRLVARKSVLGASIYTAAIPLAFLSIWASVACIAVVPVMFFLPDRSAAKTQAASRSR